MQVFYLFSIAAGFVLMILGFRSFTIEARATPKEQIIGAVEFFAGIVLTFGGILLYNVPGFFS